MFSLGVSPTVYLIASVMPILLPRLKRATMIGTSEPLEIAKLCEGGGPMLEFLPLVLVHSSFPDLRGILR